MSNSTVGIRLENELQERLKALGVTKDRTPHYLMKKAVEEYIEREEYKEKEKQIMQQRWEQFVLTGESLEHTDIKQWAQSLPSA